jgi:hypothetical protein
MNAIVEAKPIFSLAPQTFEQAVTMANMLADSDLVPKDFKGKPGNCMIAMQWGTEIGLQALQAMQNIAVFNGRPSLWGDAVIALARSSPACEYILETQTATEATCRVKRRGEPEQVRTFSMTDAKLAGLWGKAGPWTQYPKRMMQMRARAFAIRDVFPDVLKGLPIAEEVMDTPTHMGPVDEVLPAQDGKLVAAQSAADKGLTAYQEHFKGLSKEDRKHIAGHHDQLKARAEAVDAARTLDSVTFEDAMQALCAATTQEELYKAGALIDHFSGEQADLLNGKFEERVEELNGGAA